MAMARLGDFTALALGQAFLPVENASAAATAGSAQALGGVVGAV